MTEPMTWDHVVAAVRECLHKTWPDDAVADFALGFARGCIDRTGLHPLSIDYDGETLTLAYQTDVRSAQVAIVRRPALPRIVMTWFGQNGIELARRLMVAEAVASSSAAVRMAAFLDGREPTSNTCLACNGSGEAEQPWSHLPFGGEPPAPSRGPCGTCYGWGTVVE